MRYWTRRDSYDWNIEPKHESEYEEWIHLENYVRGINEKYCEDEEKEEDDE